MVEVAGSVLGCEIAPALERAPRARLDQDKLWLQHQVAAADPFLVDEWAHVDNALAAHDLTADHPIERAAVAQFVGALGHHTRPVHVLAREAAFPALLELLANPILEVLDGVATNAKLDEMKGHAEYCQTKYDNHSEREARCHARVELILIKWIGLLRRSKRGWRRAGGSGARCLTRRRICL